MNILSAILAFVNESSFFHFAVGLEDLDIIGTPTLFLGDRARQIMHTLAEMCEELGTTKGTKFQR